MLRSLHHPPAYGPGDGTPPCSRVLQHIAQRRAAGGGRPIVHWDGDSRRLGPPGSQVCCNRSSGLSGAWRSLASLLLVLLRCRMLRFSAVCCDSLHSACVRFPRLPHPARPQSAVSAVMGRPGTRGSSPGRRPVERSAARTEVNLRQGRPRPVGDPSLGRDRQLRAHECQAVAARLCTENGTTQRVMGAPVPAPPQWQRRWRSAGPRGDRPAPSDRPPCGRRGDRGSGRCRHRCAGIGRRWPRSARSAPP